MLPKKGKKLPLWKGVLSGRQVYTLTIADLLKKEHGDSHRAIKQLMFLTNASERTVKHWLSAQHGPDTVFFLRLVVSSPVIRAFVVGLIEGPASKSWAVTADHFSLSLAREAYVAGEGVLEGLVKDDRKNITLSDPVADPENDPELKDLNERQQWFLNRLTEGARCDARVIMTLWRVSLKTARRDIRTLQQAHLLEYVGSCRKGHYRRIVS